MSTSSDFKQKGNAAYNAEDYETAIAAYTSAIELSPNDPGYYSNRSAAYLMVGDFDNALADAEACITIKWDCYKGYGRKGATYYAMNMYDRAIATYKEGLKACPDNKQLRVGLQAARRARAEKSKASNTVRKTEIVTHVTRRKSLQSSLTVSDFVQQKREHLLLQKAQIQAQLDLIDDLAAMEDEGKLDLLFTLIDRDGDGTIDPDELAAALRKRQKELAFQESIDKALELVATHDHNGDGKLDLYEFKSCIYDMITKLNVSFGEFAEFLVFQINSYDDTNGSATTEDNNAMKETEEFKIMVENTRMEELFVLFDKDGSGELTFKEVAIGLYQITRNIEESTKAAMDLLLMMDKNDSRTLNYFQFCRLIMAIVATAGSTFDEIVDELILNLSRPDKIAPDDLASLTVADVIYETTCVDKNVSKKQGDTIDVGQIVSNLSYGRLKKLFDLWDVNHDGDISLAELTIGMKAFLEAVKINGDPELEARTLLKFDSNNDNRLNQSEFSEAIIHYSKSFGIELHTLIDFMCVTNTMGNGTGNNSFQHIFGSGSLNDKIPTLPVKRLSLLIAVDFDEEISEVG